MGWRVELTGDNSDLEVLERLFTMRPVYVHRKGERYVLEADSIDALEGDNPVEHLDTAEALLIRVNGFAISADPAQRPVRLSGAMETSDGQRHTVARAGVAEPRVRVFAPTIGADGPGAPPAYGPRVLEAAETDTAISDVLTLVGSHPHDFYTLYKIFEIIEKRVGKQKGSDADRFTMSANNRAASGLVARHAIYNKPSKLRPMTIEEARLYVLGLANSFLASHA